MSFEIYKPEEERLNTVQRELEDLIKQVLKNGWKVKAGVNHSRMVYGRDEGPVFLARSPSDTRSVKNARAELKRKGYLEAKDVVVKKRAINPLGHRVTPSEQTAKDLKKLLVELGEDPNRPEDMKGHKGGARTLLCQHLNTIYERRGMDPPSYKAHGATIRGVLARKQMGSVKLGLIEEAIEDLMAPVEPEPVEATVEDVVEEAVEAPVETPPAPVKKHKNGKVKTSWQCQSCFKTFASLEHLNEHVWTEHHPVRSEMPDEPEVVAADNGVPPVPLKDELYMQVMLAILDPDPTRRSIEVALELGEKVRNLQESQ